MKRPDPASATALTKAWQDRAIYFVLIDRFHNGDKSNDDFGKGEYDPNDDNCFQGGDIKGVTLKLPFIRAMGFDALWITPPVHNQWLNPYTPARGYHGYWTYDFTRVDPHFGTLDDYKEMVREAHRLGIKVIQDIVVNHTGNYFTVEEKGYDPARPELNWKELAGACPPEEGPKAPNDPVFRLNNPNIKEHREAAVYNFTPNISDFKSREQTLTYALGDLDDINLKSPAAANRLKEVYRYWIKEAGVDGFRVDTVFYTPEDFYEGFLYDADPANPGVKTFAGQTGKEDFLVFGEVWSYDYKAIGRYLREGPTLRLDSAIDLPLSEALTQIFYRKVPTATLKKPFAARRLNRNLWVNFLDNHDIERMNSRASWPSVRQSLAALFTLPGIPCVYYGTEAGFKAVRQNMFAEEHFSGESKQRAFLEKLTGFRKEHPAFSRGKCRLEKTSFSCGVLSYRTSYRGKTYLSVFNTSTDRMVYGAGRPGCRYEALLSSEEGGFEGGILLLAPNSYFIFREEPAGAPPEPAARPLVAMRPLKAGAYRDLFNIEFDLADPDDVASLYLLPDDNYEHKLQIWDFQTGTFALNPAALGNGRHKLSLLARTKAGAFAVSNESVITVRRSYELLAGAVVPEDNRRGVGRKLEPPADPSYNGQLSIEKVSVYSSGRDVRLKLKMANITNDWNAPNGYDHVYFSVFFDFPGRPGQNFFPKLNYGREDFKFNAGFLLYGWGALSFGAEDSTPDSYGAPLIGEVAHSVDLKKKTITFTFSNKFFDSLDSLSGVKVFISTWDGYLGQFRTISDKQELWNFYTLEGVKAESLPMVFDHLIVHLI